MGQREIIINAGRRDVGDLTWEIGPGAATVDGTDNFVIGNDVNSASRAQFGFSDAQSVFFNQSTGNDANSGTRASPYQTVWRAFQDVDNSTKFVAVQLDTGDIDIGTIPERLQSDPDLGAAADLSPNYEGQYVQSLPVSTGEVFVESNNGRIIMTTGNGSIYYTDNLGRNFESVANSTSQTQKWAGSLVGTDNVLIGPEGEDDTTAAFLSSSNNSGSYTTVTAAGMSMTFDQIEFILGGNSSFTRKWFVSVDQGANRQILTADDSNVTGSTTWAVGYTAASTDQFVYGAHDRSDNVVFFSSSGDLLHYADSTNTFTLGAGQLTGLSNGVAWNGTRFMAVSSTGEYDISADGTTGSWSAATSPGITATGIAAADGIFYVWNATDIYISDDNGTSWNQLTEDPDYATGDSRGGVAIYDEGVLTIADFSASDWFQFSDGTFTYNAGGLSGYTLTNDFASSAALAGVTKTTDTKYNSGDITQCDLAALVGFGGAASSTITQSEFSNTVTIAGDSSGALTFTKNDVQAAFNYIADSGTIMDNLVVGAQSIEKKSDNTNTVDIQNNTLIGDLTITNSDVDSTNGSGFVVADNLHEGNITGSTATNLINFQSGNVRGTTSNISNTGMSSENPLFANTTDYMLQYIVNGDSANSPFIMSSVETVTVTSGQRRAFGCWSFDTSTVSKGFSISERIPLPQEKNSGLQWIQNNVANLQIPEGGVPDVFNNITKQTEELLINYRSVEKKVINFFNLIETTYEDLTVEIILQPFLLSDFPSSVTANGAQTAGTAVVDVTTTGRIFPGYLVTIDGVDYNVLYPIPLSGVTTSIVLDRVTETDLANAESITVKAPVEKSEWQYVPEAKKQIGATIPELVSLQTEPVDNIYWNGLKLRFIRKRNG